MLVLVTASRVKPLTAEQVEATRIEREVREAMGRNRQHIDEIVRKLQRDADEQKFLDSCGPAIKIFRAGQAPELKRPKC
jgi:hypothetical protein